MKQSLEMQLSQSQSSLQQLQHQFSQEREHLRMQLDELQTEHQRRQQRLQEAHRCAMQDMEHARQRDLKVTDIKVTQKGCYRAFLSKVHWLFFFLIKKFQILYLYIIAIFFSSAISFHIAMLKPLTVLQWNCMNFALLMNAIVMLVAFRSEKRIQCSKFLKLSFLAAVGDSSVCKRYMWEWEKEATKNFPEEFIVWISSFNIILC